MKKHSFLYQVRSSAWIVIGLVLVWRGIWYVLDKIDAAFFAGGHICTALGGIALGLVCLYLPDHDLKELQKL